MRSKALGCRLLKARVGFMGNVGGAKTRSLATKSNPSKKKNYMRSWQGKEREGGEREREEEEDEERVHYVAVGC